jgi:hypothetical protein
VTARSRLIVGHQETGTPQIVAEMAAPLVLRTPMCTVVATATTECGWKHGDTGAQENRAENSFRKRAHQGEGGKLRGGRGGRCACASDPAKRHGPYFELTYKANGKTINVKLSPEAAPLYKAAAQQYRRLKTLLNRLDKLSKTILRHQAKLAESKRKN